MQVTDRQRQLLTIVSEWRDKHGFSPSYCEIGELMECSAQGVEYKVRSLLGKGFLKREYGACRSLRVTPEGMAAIRG